VAELKFNSHALIAQQRAMEQVAMRSGTFPTSGFLSNPGGQSGPTGGGPTPPSRMDGEMREQEQSAA